MNWKGKKVLVIGMGHSGLAAARVLHEEGAQITLTDIKRKEELVQAIQSIEDLPVRLELGAYPEVNMENTDVVIISPGVPLSIAPVQQARASRIPVWSEIEAAYRFLEGPVVAITGTNGKTTTTALVGEMFKDAGRPVLVAGNIGIPLIREARSTNSDTVIVVEASSFQLETIDRFRPRVAVILNITPDHLDRHLTLEKYIQAKARIFENQSSSDFTILNYDDERVRSLASKTPGRVIFFSRQHMLEPGVYVQDGNVVVAIEGKKEVVCPAEEINIKGSHNLENALAGVAAGSAMGLAVDSIARTLRTFPGVAHRLEFVAEFGGVKYINDSKGTNPDAAIKALEAYAEPVVLIAGGKNKGSDFSSLAIKIKEKVRALVLVGEAAGNIQEAVEKVGFKNFYRVDTFEEAVKTAASLALPGDVVLLSPACASWDMFRSYEERGERFKSLVMQLKAGMDEGRKPD
ncbi:UDP-N-acetylmuramoyl-L-alanine--D-glutamate ligase [Calderihabitans maritimus]|uniref:UDP-N-acetylmuramoylalanine--D-glutamate ligase n=1 Tax=Calderihabitans maritimus TaxID=1246530 RepID=A0A1Z5HRJ7_9FIRM|nr:UDP-N-acetylmuramoyl-L-alanine--D-glutamate ligase [Calderihabitans maritimus]GAW92146.1 UDP-N-acetylmuramoyl-L-alanyl-D-glutamate synthetase [Calderihabitans maritimus]